MIFDVIKKIKQKMLQGEHGNSIAIMIALAAVAIGVLLAYGYSDIVRGEQTTANRIAINQQADSIRSSLQLNIQSYEEMLDAAAAFHTLSTSKPTKDEWRQYVEALRINKMYSGTLGLGYVDYLGNDKTAIKYLEPAIPANVKAIGYDMFSEEKRRVAMATARDSGEAHLSEPVKLVQDANNPNALPGVLMYKPVYRSDADTSSIEKRREALEGYVYVVFRPSDIVLQSEVADSKKIVYEVSDSKTNKMIARAGDTAARTNATMQSTFDFEKPVQTWKLQVWYTSSDRASTELPIFLFGVATSIMTGGLIYLLLWRWLRRVADVHKDRVQQSKNDFVALASHQLRTPATAVKQYIGLLEQGIAGRLTDQQTTIMQKAYDANERQLETIEQLLYVAKADAGQLKPHFKDIRLREMLQQTLEAFTPQADSKNMTLELRGGAHVVACTDEQMLRMCIENLVSNAIKYSPAGTTVTLYGHRKKSDVVLGVIDQGVGIDEADQQKLFQKFSRIENEYMHSAGGSGLGLYMVQQLVHALGGTITVHSEANKGSTFEIIIPQKRST